MTDARRDLEAFARAVEALGPYLDDLVFVGGWAHYLYTLMPEAAPLGFTPLTTDDADIAAPLRLRVRGKTIPELLIASGFEQRLSGDHTPPVSEYTLGDEESGFYLRVRLLPSFMRHSYSPDFAPDIPCALARSPKPGSGCRRRAAHQFSAGLSGGSPSAFSGV